MKKWIMRGMLLGLVITAVMVFPAAGQASSHTPLLSIEDKEDGTIYVEAGFSDGSSATGMPCKLLNKDGKVLWEGKFDIYSSVTVKKPDADPYFVVFDGGPGHVVTKEGPPLSPAEGGRAEAPVAEPATMPETPEGSAPAAPGEIEPGELAEAAPAATATPAWTPGTTTATPQAQGPDNTLLWVIAGLLSAIALAVVLLCAGAFFLVGWTIGRKARGQKLNQGRVVPLAQEKR